MYCTPAHFCKKLARSPACDDAIIGTIYMINIYMIVPIIASSHAGLLANFLQK